MHDVARELDLTLPVSNVDTLQTVVARARQQRAFVMVLIVVAAVLALLLGTVGLYGVVSYHEGETAPRDRHPHGPWDPGERCATAGAS